MENPKPATKRCGACIALSKSCSPDCFWAPYFKPGDVDKFRYIIKDTPANILQKKVKKEKIKSRPKFIDGLYEKKRKRESEHEKAKAVLTADSESLNHHEGKEVPDLPFKWGARKRSCTCQQPTTRGLLILAEAAEIVKATGLLFEMENGQNA